MILPVDLLQELIRCPSVTPNEGGAIRLLEKVLSEAGFECHWLKFSDDNTPDIENLYARFGKSGPHLCFAGHTDVVPVGEENAWTFDPFGGVIRDGYVCGRGAADMKGGVAASVAAAVNYIKSHTFDGSISFLITGDEESVGTNGTIKVLKWMAERGEKPDFCVLGEPTSVKELGDMVKIGRRGTYTAEITVTGVQGHVAYPHLADNPVPKLLALLTSIDALVLDTGTAHFQPSNLEIVNIDINNKASNVIPEKARATFNVRFNDTYTGDTLDEKLRQVLDACNIPYHIDSRIGGESFYTTPGVQSDLLVNAIRKVTGHEPVLSTSGGTSDARYIKDYFPVMEFGVVGETMHKIDERVAVADMNALAEIYYEVIKSFMTPPC
jgi:succinyl-diaminopimelate desuccinylase